MTERLLERRSERSMSSDMILALLAESLRCIRAKVRACLRKSFVKAIQFIVWIDQRRASAGKWCNNLSVHGSTPSANTLLTTDWWGLELEQSASPGVLRNTCQIHSTASFAVKLSRDSKDCLRLLFDFSDRKLFGCRSRLLLTRSQAYRTKG